ncbi:hypothetical protein EVAR_54326_1 [Eumeta japonica]|uniref:Uncharacterized protein n=1 Tax=Eumeta variegata TaxID=151549 RepID=A0A4C1Y647_EUMVA|nr:hypothetical protein EVAR_54326_1 [Eumeta japonica]
MSGYLHPLLFKAWREGFPDKTPKICQQESNLFWTTNKEVFKNDDNAFGKFVSQKINDLKQLAAKKKNQHARFFKQQNVSGGPLTLMEQNSMILLWHYALESRYDAQADSKDTIPDKSQLTCHPTPAQDAIEKKFHWWRVNQIQVFYVGILVLEGSRSIKKSLKCKKNSMKLKNKLANKKRNAEYQKSFRKKRQALIKDVIKNPVVKQQLNVHETVGRPRLEEAQPELLKVLAEIASFGGGADEKCRTEMIRSCRTLDDLVKELEALVPVKLARATNDEHKSHPDGKFCTASIRAIESRLNAWACSVYAGIEINTDGMGRPEVVTYSGPTYVAIRSGKHSSSSARTHSIDLEHLMELTEFQSLAKTDYNSIKPVIIMTVDGGPDENPRFPQVIFHAISHFRKFDLDAIFIITNAPGRSCFNRVERRMAPLSHQLSGLILLYDFFGNHLDDQRRTIDNELELKNFKMAEWYDNEDIDIEKIEVPQEEHKESVIPVIESISECGRVINELIWKAGRNDTAR